MPIRKAALLAAISALGVMAMASSASATTNIRVDPAGTVIGHGTITNATSDTSGLTLSGFGHLTCEVAKFDADVPGTAFSSITGVLTNLTLSSCNDTLAIITVNSCHLHNRGVPSVHINATSGAGGNVVLNNTLLRCVVAGSPHGCYYRASTASAVAANNPSVIVLPNVLVSHTASGTTDDLGAVCGDTGSFTSVMTGITNSAGSRVTLTTS